MPPRTLATRSRSRAMPEPLITTFGSVLPAAVSYAVRQTPVPPPPRQTESETVPQ